MSYNHRIILGLGLVSVEFKNLGIKATAFQCDLSNPTETVDTMKQISSLGSVNTLVRFIAFLYSFGILMRHIKVYLI